MNQHVSNFTKGLLKTLVHGTMSGLGMQIGKSTYDQLQQVYPRLKTEVYPALKDRMQSLKARFTSCESETTEPKQD